MERRVLASITALSAVLLVSMAQVPAFAAAEVRQERSRGQLGGSYASGSPINGVSADLRVRPFSPSITATASDIFMSAADGTFIQFGIVQGRARFGGCGSESYVANFTEPHLFLGAQLASQSCETLRDLGAFGSVNNFRSFGLRRNANGTYYATLDGVTKYTTSITFPEAMQPGVVAEANDSCAFVEAWAQNKNAPSSTFATLAWHDNARGWQYWTTQYNSQSVKYAANWSTTRPAGSGAAIDTYGTYNSPDC